MIQGVITDDVTWSFSSKTKKDKYITSLMIFVNIYHQNELEQQFQIV